MFAEIDNFCGKDDIIVRAHKDEKIDFLHLFTTLVDDLGIEPVDDDGLMVPISGGNDYAYYQFKCGEWVYLIDYTDIKCLRDIQYACIPPLETFSEWVSDVMDY